MARKRKEEIIRYYPFGKVYQSEIVREFLVARKWIHIA